MLPKSVSPRFVSLAAMPVAFLLYLPLIPLENALIRLLPIPLGDHPSIVFLPVFFLSTWFLAPRALGYLGIQVRSRSVERFQATEREDEYVGAVELSIRIYRAQWLIRVVPVVLFLGGLVCLVLALCVMLTWFPPPRAREDPLVFTVAMIGMGFLLMAGAFLARRCKPELLCEISDKGIRTPDGFWGRLTFVPWGDLVRCEIIRDDERWCDHFLLWDRKGRRRFKRSKHWMGVLRRSDRTRIFRVLRSRFPQKAKPDQNPETSLAGVASSHVWDRELDG